MGAIYLAVILLVVLILMYVYPPTRHYSLQLAPWLGLLAAGLVLGSVLMTGDKTGGRYYGAADRREHKSRGRYRGSDDEEEGGNFMVESMNSDETGVEGGGEETTAGCGCGDINKYME